jgi:hypothetical protein
VPARISALALTVPDHDVAIAFWMRKLGLTDGFAPGQASPSGAIRSATAGT